MKKSVLATVLAVSLLFTACATKDQKTTSENETSEAVSETTEKPSESETDTTEDPTDPSVNEIVSYDAPSFSEVDYLSYQIETEEVFDFLSKDIKGIEEEDWFSGYNCIEYYIGSCGIPVFEGDAYEKLNAAVKEDFEKIIPNGKEYLESRKDEFSAKFAKEYYSINSEDSLLPAVLRADEKITTIFYPFQVDGEKVVEVTSENLINYDTATGKRIALSDVVKDKDRFTELAKEAILNSTTYDFSGPYQEEEVLSFLNSDNIPFTIDYSGIGVYFQQTVSVSDLSGTGRIEYIGNEDVFNGEYFDVLPEDYVLHITPNSDFYWDLDGDGKTEKILVAIDMMIPFYDIDSFSIFVDDQETVIDASDVGMPDSLSLIHTHGQDFLYFWTVREDDIMGVSIFEIVDKKVEDRGGSPSWLPNSAANFDPNHVELVKDTYVVGRENYGAVYSIGSDGKPVSDEEAVSFVHYYGHIFPCLKKDLKVDQVDPETLETKGTITLKAGTSLRPISTNRKGWEEEAFEIFKVIDKDTSKEVYVKLDLSFAEDDSVAKINGESVMDLFVRVFMGA